MEEMIEEIVETVKKSNNQMDDDSSVKTFDKILRMNMSDSDDSDEEEPLDVYAEKDEAKRMEMIAKCERILKTGRVDATEQDDDKEDSHNDRVTAVDEIKDGTIMLYYGLYHAARYPPRKVDENKTTIQTKMEMFFNKFHKINATRKDTT